ncbi:hypothetical protein F441_17210 [Phytophthora nicotianae CJ01A1]|uniref:Uncharacterized protein n=1 Tax=Phytophthora nicotianae CJ01A1 TaxID=1317063 RepID=W2W7F7_PHYNI|nr:hypothetical protein F441_17210 [Phytophthora nicotianae CJ01A1]
MDKELMREVIKQRPFAAKYGETAEAITRRALRGEYLLSSDSSPESEDDTSSVASTQSVASQANATRTVTFTRRNNMQTDCSLNESVTKLENVPNFGLHERANNPKNGTDN